MSPSDQVTFAVTLQGPNYDGEEYWNELPSSNASWLKGNLIRALKETGSEAEVVEVEQIHGPT